MGRAVPKCRSPSPAEIPAPPTGQVNAQQIKIPGKLPPEFHVSPTVVAVASAVHSKLAATAAKASSPSHLYVFFAGLGIVPLAVKNIVRPSAPIEIGYSGLLALEPPLLSPSSIIPHRTKVTRRHRQHATPIAASIANTVVVEEIVVRTLTNGLGYSSGCTCRHN